MFYSQGKVVSGMLTKFELKNYKNFKEKITLDLTKVGGYQFSTDCVKNNVLNKVLMYGKNATGKTNFGRAVIDIRQIISGNKRLADGIFLNASSEENSVLFSYTFQFGDNEVVYQYKRLSQSRLSGEELWIDGRQIYQVDFVNKKCEFLNLSIINAETINIDRYILALDTEDNLEEDSVSQIPFLRWLINNTAFDSDSVIISLADYVLNMRMMTTGRIGGNLFTRGYDAFFEQLADKKELDKFEGFLNYMGVSCRLAVERIPDGRYELYFKYKKLVPFRESASRGTVALLNIYRRIINIAKKSTLLYLDEYDAFFHYEMAEKLIIYFKQNFPDSQMIFTTHNTSLMSNRLLRPDCLFILSEKGNLTALCDATNRELREGHNLRKMYISGEFEEFE